MKRYTLLQVHHAISGIISDEPEMLQCARVVAWLEELASSRLDYNAEQGQGEQCACLRASSKHVPTQVMLLQSPTQVMLLQSATTTSTMFQDSQPHLADLGSLSDSL